jgi:phage baseplate assembly protein W
MKSYYSDIDRRYLQDSIELVITDDFKAVEANIDNILECPPRSFLFNRGFGSRLRSFLFEPMNEQTALGIKINLIEAIKAWEPRITISMRNTYVTPDYDNHTYYVRIIYILKSNEQAREYARVLPTQTGR